MTVNKKIRLANEGDSASILSIYAPYVTDTTVTFEYEVPTAMEFAQRIRKIQKQYPYLVCEFGNNIAGYAYASRFRERRAYDWSVELSIYVNPEYQGKRIGKALYYCLFELLKLQGFHNAYSGVTQPNVKSESLHQSLSFETIGVYRNVGYKFGQWHNVKWYGLELAPHAQSPEKTKSIDEISNTTEFMKAIEKAERMIT